ncbi:MAG: hypothetical protein AB7O50_03190 [Pseudolabrys sp.]
MTHQNTLDQRDPRRRDSEAAGAFSMRTMTQWQLWGISIATVLAVIGLLVYANTL